MTKTNFEALDVYKLSERLADEVWNIVFSRGAFSKSTVGKQLVRSADSIGANIAEGNGRWHYKYNKRFVRMARGSLYETRHWLRRAYKRKLLDEAQTNSLKKIVDELSPRLNAYLKSIGTKKIISTNN